MSSRKSRDLGFGPPKPLVVAKLIWFPILTLLPFYAIALAVGLPPTRAILFFALQEIFGDFGAWYLAGVGIVAILFALYLPNGIVGMWLNRGRAEPLSMRKRLKLEG